MTLSKLWLFLKHYWYIPLVLVLLLCAFVVYRSKISSLLGVIDSAREEHRRSLEKLSAATTEKVRTERIATDKHIEDMTSIELEKQREIEEVLTKIEKREAVLEGDIDEIARQLQKEFGD